jgi:hypothetical protein
LLVQQLEAASLTGALGLITDKCYGTLIKEFEREQQLLQRFILTYLSHFAGARWRLAFNDGERCRAATQSGQLK